MPDPLADTRPKTQTAGTHRTLAFDETLARIAPHARAMGVTRVANVTGLDRIGIPVVMVCRPNARSLAVSQGKGLTLEAAKVSGLMEAIELYHAEHVRLPQVYGSLHELQSHHDFIDPGRIPATAGSRWDPFAPGLWTTVRTLDHAREALAPFETIHASALNPPPPGSGCFLSTSNGLASGNSVAEALTHAVCEMIERDATTLWEARGLQAQAASRLDLATVDDPDLLGLLDRFEAAGFSVAVFETTSDLEVPAFLAEISDRQWDPGVPLRSFTGMGCHTNRTVALARALTEAAQCRLTMISGARDDIFREEYAEGPRRRGYAARHAAADLAPGHRAFAEVPDLSADTCAGDLRALEAQLAARGLGPIWYADLTRAEYGLAVVRAIVPGLEGPDEAPDYVAGPRACAVQREQAA